MSTSQSTLDFLLDQLASLPGVRVRNMFGEYALYCEEKVVALVCDNQLFVKITGWKTATSPTWLICCATTKAASRSSTIGK